jgi:hypothetical protein
MVNIFCLSTRFVPIHFYFDLNGVVVMISFSSYFSLYNSFVIVTIKNDIVFFKLFLNIERNIFCYLLFNKNDHQNKREINR